MRRISLVLLAATTAVVLSVQPLVAQQLTSLKTCDEAGIKPESYRLTTEAQALNVLRPREPWWEPYDTWKSPREIGSVNEGSVRLAERAKELDERNLLAHGYLARQYVVLAIDASKAEDAWRRVVDSGGAIVWTGSLYEVDARSFFVFAFDQQGIRVFRYGELAGQLRTHFGVPEVPEPDRVEFWRALGGCLAVDATPEVEIPWSSVRELRATTWTLRFELSDKLTIKSDRRRQRTSDTLEVNLHPGVGEADFRFGMTPFGWAPFGPPPAGTGPGAFHHRVKQMIETVFETTPNFQRSNFQGARGTSSSW